MAYFLGRDVSVYIGTESNTANKNIGVVSGTVAGAPSCTVSATGTSNTTYFAYSLDEGATVTGWPAAVADLTGVDVSIGAMDEDITYIGQKGTGKVEIKKEYTISLTKKKNDDTWDTIFNGPCTAASAETDDGKHGARWGLAGDYGTSTAAAPLIADGLANPYDYNNGTTVQAGFRVFLVVKSGSAGETLAFPNCLITSHTTSLNADGVTEETMEFSTQQNMLQGVDGDNFNVTETVLADY